MTENVTTTEMPAEVAVPDLSLKIDHSMVDLETLGKKPYCPILSIGACGFSFDHDGEDYFYVPVSLESCMQLGMKLDASTIIWWMKQSDEARMAAFCNPEAVPLPMALDMFTTYLASRPITLWGNSARFDMGILDAAYEVCGKQTPWQFWSEGDYRTIKQSKRAKEIKLVRFGEHHNALDDAVSQARHLKTINSQLELGM